LLRIFQNQLSRFRERSEVPKNENPKGGMEMKAKEKIIVAGVIIMALALLPCLSIAGSIEPPANATDTSGNPVPTMKTLDQIPPTWSRKLPCDSATNCPRFEVLADFNNEAVLDKETGLVWRRSPWNYQGNWWNAKNTCLAGCLGGRCGTVLGRFYLLFVIGFRSREIRCVQLSRYL
jgi:hypothetical protein